MAREFSSLSPVEQHAYRNYGSEEEYRAAHDNLLRQHFAGPYAGHRDRGGTLPWRASDAQRAAYWQSQQTRGGDNNSAATSSIARPVGSNFNDLRQAAQDLIARDRTRLASAGAPVYRGRQTVPMSALEQRRRQLETKFRNEPAPYSQEASRAFNKQAAGFSPEQTESLVDRLGRGSSNFAENIALRKLQKQFGSFYDGREDKFRRKVYKNLDRSLPLSRVAFNNTSEQAKNLNAGYNEALGNTFNVLGGQERAKREGLTGMLGSFGNQEHTYGNLKNQADRATFDREVNAPYKKMNSLSSLLNTYGGNADNMSTAEEASNIAVLKKAMQTYQSPTASYPGQKVASMTPELEQSHILLQRLNHDYDDKSADERRTLASSLDERVNVGTRAIDSLDDSFLPQEQNYDAETKRAIKLARNKVAASNIQRGVFGSQSHQAQTEAAIRNVLRDRFGGRTNLLNDTLRGSLSNLNTQDSNDITRLGSLGRQGLNEYKNALNSIQSLNNQGVTSWSNNQAGLNTQMQNFDDEENWEWPHLRGNRNASSNPHISGISTQGGINQGITNQVNTQAMNANAPIAPYSEVERAAIPNVESINNDEQLRNAMNPPQPDLPFPASWDAYRALGGNDRNRLMQLYPEQAERARVEGSVYWSNPNWRQQEAERIRRLNEEHAARINQEAMNRLRGINPVVESTGRDWRYYSGISDEARTFNSNYPHWRIMPNDNHLAIRARELGLT